MEFSRYITSDCDAVAIIYEDQHYATCAEDAVTDVLKAGRCINLQLHHLCWQRYLIDPWGLLKKWNNIY